MSSYRGDLSSSDRADLASFKPDTCRHCGGSGVVYSRSSAPVPCGCDVEPAPEAPAYCETCEGGGWTGHFGPQGSGPDFRECEACGNPEEIDSP